MAGDVLVQVEGQRIRLSNLDKVLYPEDGFTKGQVINYYSRVAPALLPHVADRPTTLRRYPDGVETMGFYDKNASRYAPKWIRTVTVRTPGSVTGAESLDFAVLDGLPSLVWAANMAGLELHTPQWKVDARGGKLLPDRLVLDLDPGPPATIVECCLVAMRLREVLGEDGLEPVVKTSGSKGMQLYVPVTTTDEEQAAGYARALAERLEQELPKLVVSRMTKRLRRHKVLIDWDQNSPGKTTIAPYSLRARPRPTVSTPITWDEVGQCARPADLVFTADEVLERVADHGDLFAPLLSGDAPPLPP